MADMFADYRRQQSEKDPKQTSAASSTTSVTSSMSPPSSGLQKAYGMAYEILYSGANSMLRLQLPANSSIKAESGAMVAMSPTVDVEGKLEGGLLGGLGRMFSGENFFFQTLKANRGAGEVYLSPVALGTLQTIEMGGSHGYVVQKNGFFAGTEGIQVNTKVQNLSSGFLSGQGFFVLNISGQGLLFISSYGAIHPIDIPAGEEFIIDNEHLVAWPDNVDFNIEKASSGWISSFTSGEGFVCRFRGPARVFIQTRNPSAFGDWIRSIVNSGSDPA